MDMNGKKKELAARSLAELPYDSSVRPIWETVVELGASVPGEEWARVPRDLSKLTYDDDFRQAGYRALLRDDPLAPPGFPIVISTIYSLATWLLRGTLSGVLWCGATG